MLNQVNQKALCVKVNNMIGGFGVEELQTWLSNGFTVNNAYASTDNSLLVILDPPKQQDE